MKAIEVKCLEHKFQDSSKISICGMEFHADLGETVALIGQNGSGKTTLFFHVVGLLTPSGGSVRVLGADVNSPGFEKARRNVGMVFQEVENQLIGPTVWDDIAFAPFNAGWAKKDVEAGVEEMMGHFGISHLADRVPHYLSGGEKKKVALAGTMVMRPKILLLDEPFAHLDPSSKRDLIRHIEHYRAEGDKCVLITEHDLGTIHLLSDRVYLLEKGKGMTFEGTPEQLMEDRDALSRADIEIPELDELFMRLRKEGYKVKVPKTAEEALQALKKMRK